MAQGSADIVKISSVPETLNLLRAIDNDLVRFSSNRFCCHCILLSLDAFCWFGICGVGQDTNRFHLRPSFLLWGHIDQESRFCLTNSFRTKREFFPLRWEILSAFGSNHSNVIVYFCLLNRSETLYARKQKKFQCSFYHPVR